MGNTATEAATDLILHYEERLAILRAGLRQIVEGDTFGTYSGSQCAEIAGESLAAEKKKSSGDEQ